MALQIHHTMPDFRDQSKMVLSFRFLAEHHFLIHAGGCMKICMDAVCASPMRYQI